MNRRENLNEKSKLTILVAEDEEYNYLFISEVLKDYRVTLIRAYNGKMAVDLCQETPNIDLVLMDISMPVMDGYEASKQIKQLYPALPIVIQSSYSHNSEKNKALAQGCDGFMAKPISKKELVECIRKYIPEGVALEKI